MVSVYHDITITEFDGIVIVREVTNDNNDDGYPDREETAWEWTAPNLAAAMKHTGKSRIGISGVKVTVTVNGEEV